MYNVIKELKELWEDVNTDFMRGILACLIAGLMFVAVTWLCS